MALGSGKAESSPRGRAHGLGVEWGRAQTQGSGEAEPIASGLGEAKSFPKGSPEVGRSGARTPGGRLEP